MNTLILTVGLPRSGKTTWARKQLHPIVNPDSIRLALHGQRFQPEAERFVWATAHLMVRSLFLAGHNTVILDATNTSKKRRVEWLSSQWHTNYALIATSEQECIAQAEQEGDKEIIPVIKRMAAGWEPLDETEAPWAIKTSGE